MIDTVAIRHAYRNKPNPPLGFFLTRRNGDTVTHCRNPPKGSHLPRLTFTHQERTGGSWLSSEVSLPKFYFGNNVQMLNPEQLQTSLSDMQQFVETATELSFDVPSAKLGRVDFGYNIRLENENAVKAYLRSFNRLFLAKYKRVSIDDETVTMKSKSREVCIYSKFQETFKQKDVSSELLQQATGILRFEPRFKNVAACGRLAKSLGFENNVQSLLTPATAKLQIEAEIKRLGIGKTIKTEKNMIDLLIENFGAKASEYYGFLKAREILGDSFYTSGAISRATYFRRVSELRNAGCLLVTEDVDLSAIRVRDSDFKSTVE
jgi:II/X family phage/plasmid replication protein